MIRWKAVIPLTILASLWSVFTLFFMDALIKRAIEKWGSRAVGAQVTVGSVDFSLRKSRAIIQNVAVANPGQPMRNAVAFKRAQFGFDLETLLQKKLHIQELSLEGLRFNEPRKQSGAIVKKVEPRKENTAFAKVKSSLKVPNFAKKSIPNFDSKMLQNVDLTALRNLEKKKTEYQDLADSWQKKINELDFNSEIQQSQKLIADAQKISFSSPQDVLGAKALLEEAQTLQSNLAKKRTTIETLEKQLRSDLSSQKELQQLIKNWKEQDVASILQSVGLPDLSANSIAQTLFGPVWVDRIGQAQHWISLARKVMPPPNPKEVKPIPPARRKGIDVTFPGRKNLPKLWIEKILISGTALEENADWRGEVQHITSNQPLLGRATTLNLALKNANATTVQLNGILNHVQTPPQDSITIQADAIPLSNFIEINEAGVRIAAGQANATMQLKFIGDDFVILSKITAHGVRWASDDANGAAGRFLFNLLNQFSTFTVDVKGEQKAEEFQFNVSSSLDQQLGEAVKKALGQEVAALRAQVEQQVNERINVEQSKVLNQIADSQKDLLGNLNQQAAPLLENNAAVTQLLDELNKKISNSAGNQIKNLLPGKVKDLIKF